MKHSLVTGGGGFLGRAIVERLLATGAHVTSLSRGAHPELEALGVRTVRADVADAGSLGEVFAGADAVFHAAAKTGIWGNEQDFRRTNVEGTRNVIRACVEHGVPRLIYTSSPSVVFDGQDHRRASNDLPYARKFLCHYAASKALAEKEVLAANGRAGLSTCALRPHLVFGPGDPHLVPRLVDRARRRRLMIVGDGRNEVSLSFVVNAAKAHVDAASSLRPGARHAGQAYFIAQEEPVLLWRWIGELLARLGLPPARTRLPRRVAYAIGAGMEIVWRHRQLPNEPPMTRFLALQLSTSHSYDLRPAHRDFGYCEEVPMAEAVDRLVASLAEPSVKPEATEPKATKFEATELDAVQDS